MNEMGRTGFEDVLKSSDAQGTSSLGLFFQMMKSKSTESGDQAKKTLAAVFSSNQSLS